MAVAAANWSQLRRASTGNLNVLEPPQRDVVWGGCGEGSPFLCPGCRLPVAPGFLGECDGGTVTATVISVIGAACEVEGRQVELCGQCADERHDMVTRLCNDGGLRLCRAVGSRNVQAALRAAGVYPPPAGRPQAEGGGSAERRARALADISSFAENRNSSCSSSVPTSVSVSMMAPDGPPPAPGTGHPLPPHHSAFRCGAAGADRWATAEDGAASRGLQREALQGTGEGGAGASISSSQAVAARLDAEHGAPPGQRVHPSAASQHQEWHHAVGQHQGGHLSGSVRSPPTASSAASPSESIGGLPAAPAGSQQVQCGAEVLLAAGFASAAAAVRGAGPAAPPPGLQGGSAWQAPAPRRPGASADGSCGASPAQAPVPEMPHPEGGESVGAPAQPQATAAVRHVLTPATAGPGGPGAGPDSTGAGRVAAGTAQAPAFAASSTALVVDEDDGEDLASGPRDGARRGVPPSGPAPARPPGQSHGGAAAPCRRPSGGSAARPPRPPARDPSPDTDGGAADASTAESSIDSCGGSGGPELSPASAPPLTPAAEEGEAQPPAAAHREPLQGRASPEPQPPYRTGRSTTASRPAGGSAPQSSAAGGSDGGAVDGRSSAAGSAADPLVPAQLPRASGAAPGARRRCFHAAVPTETAPAGVSITPQSSIARSPVSRSLHRPQQWAQAAPQRSSPPRGPFMRDSALTLRLLNSSPYPEGVIAETQGRTVSPQLRLRRPGEPWEPPPAWLPPGTVPTTRWQRQPSPRHCSPQRPELSLQLPPPPGARSRSPSARTDPQPRVVPARRPGTASPNSPQRPRSPAAPCSPAAADRSVDAGRPKGLVSTDPVSPPRGFREAGSLSVSVSPHRTREGGRSTAARSRSRSARRDAFPTAPPPLPQTLQSPAGPLRGPTSPVPKQSPVWWPTSPSPGLGTVPPPARGRPPSPMRRSFKERWEARRRSISRGSEKAPSGRRSSSSPLPYRCRLLPDGHETTRSLRESLPRFLSRATADSARWSIVAVCELSCPQLEGAFEACAAQLSLRGGEGAAGVHEQRYAFHGTHPSLFDSILRRGLLLAGAAGNATPAAAPAAPPGGPLGVRVSQKLCAAAAHAATEKEDVRSWLQRRGRGEGIPLQPPPRATRVQLLLLRLLPGRIGDAAEGSNHWGEYDSLWDAERREWTVRNPAQLCPHSVLLVEAAPRPPTRR
eukprot:TRINITY_DN2185_c0_g4_i1.p1 TRINITY_DN2185_c0_g4~~TRINITY_DN2185_c0_g4_i1.p1  ORF type:complete len:1214 (+),score=106.24 TRINITY_DN2185_c0_g4_i1:69-3644(+)